MLQPKIPQTLSELDIQLPGTIFGMHFKASIFRGDDNGFIFFSDEITSIMLDISEMCFDGAFFTVPVQFYQLWSIFIVIDKRKLVLKPDYQNILVNSINILIEHTLFACHSA